MKKIEKIICHTLCASGVHLLTKPFYSGIGTILAFHRVCPRSKKSRIRQVSRLEVTPEYLENTIKFFAKHKYEIISLDELSYILCGAHVNKKFVVFTFDDGYADILTYAYPIFKKYNIPFAVYIATNFPDRKAALWWHPLEELILKNNRIFIEREKRTREFNCFSVKEKENAFNQIMSIVMSGDKNNYQKQIENIFSSYEVDVYEETARLTLNWDQIRQLAACPLVTVASHSVNHFVFNRLSEPDLRYEIIESKNKLQSHINRSVEHFCYPFGTKNEIGKRECRLVKEAGFKTAVIAKAGNVFPAHKHYSECLPRAIISGEREGKNLQYLNLWINGFVGCVRNKFRRIAAH